MIPFRGPYYSLDWKKTTVRYEEDDTMPVEVEQSSSFHVFEMHAPTAGVSFFAIVLALIAIGLAYGCYRKCCYARIFAPQQSPVAFPLQPMAPQLTPAAAPRSIDQLQPLLQLLALQGALRQPALPAPPPPPYTRRITELPEATAVPQRTHQHPQRAPAVQPAASDIMSEMAAGVTALDIDACL